MLRRRRQNSSPRDTHLAPNNGGQGVAPPVGLYNPQGAGNGSGVSQASPSGRHVLSGRDQFPYFPRRPRSAVRRGTPPSSVERAGTTAEKEPSHNKGRVSQGVARLGCQKRGWGCVVTLRRTTILIWKTRGLGTFFGKNQEFPKGCPRVTRQKNLGNIGGFHMEDDCFQRWSVTFLG